MKVDPYHHTFVNGNLSFAEDVEYLHKEGSVNINRKTFTGEISHFPPTATMPEFFLLHKCKSYLSYGESHE